MTVTRCKMTAATTSAGRVTAAMGSWRTTKPATTETPWTPMRVVMTARQHAAVTASDSDLQAGEEGYEACDDGNESDLDLCRNNYALARCGDGVRRTDIQPGADGYEACDDGNELNTDGCLNTCLTPSCGDGHVRAGVEECDDANQVDTDACRTDCTNAACGDGVERTDIVIGQPNYEACDDGNQVDDDEAAATAVR